eukprot:8473501-Pyramimonas_sp.AAC.1
MDHVHEIRFTHECLRHLLWIIYTRFVLHTSASAYGSGAQDSFHIREIAGVSGEFTDGARSFRSPVGSPHA